jgi:hypothetical protein
VSGDLLRDALLQLRNNMILWEALVRWGLEGVEMNLRLPCKLHGKPEFLQSILWPRRSSHYPNPRHRAPTASWAPQKCWWSM